MNFSKTLRSFVSLVCVVSLILCSFTIPVGAVDAKSITASTSATVKQGSSGTFYVYIDSVEGLAALDVSVHFDPEKVKVTSVYNKVSCTLYDNVTNTDSVQFSYIFDGKGSSSKTQLFYFNYQVLSNAEIGDAYFDITIGEAYDSSLTDVSVSGSRCKFTITEAVPNKTCSVYGTSSFSTSVEQEFTIPYYFSTYQIASGTAVITYDAELFEVVEVVPDKFLTNKVVDISTSLPGEVYVSFVGTAYYSNTNFVSVTFKTIKNTSETSKITLKTPELLDKDINNITCSGYTTNVTINFDDDYVGDAPKMSLDGSFSYDDMKITLAVTLEKDSHLGAGDFEILFDPELVSYVSYEQGFSPTLFYVDEREVENGKLIFHIISVTDIVTEETVLNLTFDVNHPYGCKTADFTLDGSGLTNALTERILLNFIDDSILLEYLVKFMDWDGTVLSSALYHYGDTVAEPETPTRESDVYGDYTFKGWDKTVTECLADEVYTAVYDIEYTDYVVTFLNWDGSEISKSTYHYGDFVIGPETPTKESDETYTYTFAGWDKEVGLCDGDATFTATYDKEFIDYTVTFLDWDGTVLSSAFYHYGDAITEPEAPTRQADVYGSYTFAGWDKTVTECLADEVYTAVYDIEYTDYVVTFLNWDGSEISKSTYHYGDFVIGPETPTKESDETYTYTFAGWDKEVGLCDGDATFTATYDKEFVDYTVTFLDWDGTVLSSAFYHYGDAITEPETPTRESDVYGDYTFKGWDKAVTECLADEVYTAVYDLEYTDYVVTFLDWDGSELTSQTYHYGDVIEDPEVPTRQADETYTYTFAGWDKTVVDCDGDAVYIATYKSQYIEYTVTFQYEDGKVISTQGYRYGDVVVAPESIEAPAQGYAFIGWDKKITACEGDVVYVALFEKQYVSGDINGDGNVNNKDLGVLRRWLNDWDVEIDELASDVNRDGAVNNKDLGILRRYLNDWDVELK